MKFKEFSEAIALTKKKAEEEFQFGNCSSFAVALQKLIGGEFFAIVDKRNGRQMHIYVKIGDKRYDVVGERHYRTMSRTLLGDADACEEVGPVNIAESNLRKPNPKWIEKAEQYIKANKKLFPILPS